MDFIGTLASQLGVDNNQAQAVAGSVLGAIRGQVQENAGEQATSKLDAAIPQLGGWMQVAKQAIGGEAEPEAPASAPGGGLSGLFAAASSGNTGGLLSAAAGVLGGEEAEDIAKVGVILSSLGIDASKATMAAPLVVSFLKERLGDGTFDMILKAAPLLSSLKGAEGNSAGGIAGALGGLFG